MRLLALAVLAFFPPQDPKPELRRTLALVNRSAETIRAGTQVSVNLFKGDHSPQRSDVHVLHGGKALPSTFMQASIWFRVVADIPPGERDSGYEIRQAEEKGPRREADVFDFFEDFQAADLAPGRWDWDKNVTFKLDSTGLSVRELPEGRNEYAPSSFTPRLELEGAFIFDIDVYWDLAPEASFTFAAAVDLDRKVEISKEDRERVAALIRDLVAEDIQVREQAISGLMKLGSAALPQLEEAARSPDPEAKARAVATLTAMNRETALLATEFLAVPPSPSRMIHVGRLRSTQKEAFGSRGGSRISLAQGPGGRASIAWSPGRPTWSPLEGKPLRLRLSFWSSRGGPIGEFRIVRILRRRFIEHMPDAEFGPVR